MEKQRMTMNLSQMAHITRDDLRTKYGLSEQEITDLDQESQRIMGKTIMMIDTALRDESITPEDRIATGLNFIEWSMQLIEHNFESIVDSKVPKNQLN